MRPCEQLQPPHPHPLPRGCWWGTQVLIWCVDPGGSTWSGSPPPAAPLLQPPPSMAVGAMPRNRPSLVLVCHWQHVNTLQQAASVPAMGRWVGRMWVPDTAAPHSLRTISNAGARHASSCSRGPRSLPSATLPHDPPRFPRILPSPPRRLGHCSGPSSPWKPCLTPARHPWRRPLCKVLFPFPIASARGLYRKLSAGRSVGFDHLCLSPLLGCSVQKVKDRSLFPPPVPPSVLHWVRIRIGTNPVYDCF